MSRVISEDNPDPDDPAGGMKVETGAVTGGGKATIRGVEVHEGKPRG
tara:strand:- start:93 stop:233 length:141 start_codon:yes stop_codon:yes gene_type:complete